MTSARAIAVAGFLTMSVALAWGFTAGHFWSEGAVLVGMPWGIITLIDFYTGVALFCGWIAFRERSAWKTAGWIVAICLLGNLMTSLYVLLALRTSGRDARVFWMGRGT